MLPVEPPSFVSNETRVQLNFQPDSTSLFVEWSWYQKRAKPYASLLPSPPPSIQQQVEACPEHSFPTIVTVYLFIVNAFCLHRLTSHLHNLVLVHVPVLWSPPWISWLSSACYAVSGRDTPCLGHITLYLFEECGACSYYGDWLFVVPVATTNWILTIIPPYNNTSFGWFLLRKIVDYFGHTLSISLSTPTVWHSIYTLSFSRLGNLRWPFCLRGLH